MENDNVVYTGVKLIIYKKIVPGDFRKFRAESNDTDSGGGARDLRFSPAEEFTGQFKKMFLQQAGGALTGRFHWKGLPPTDVAVLPATSSRPNEIRIGTVNRCFPSQILPENSEDCILLLVLRADDMVYPCFASEHSLEHDNWHPDVSMPILNGLRANRRANTTPMGYIDVENGKEWANE